VLSVMAGTAYFPHVLVPVVCCAKCRKLTVIVSLDAYRHSRLVH